jgi:hypothetical protein
MSNSNLENEKIPGQAALLCLLSLCFLLIYFVPQLGMTEFRWRKEALYTAMAIEMNFSKPNTSAHGELISETYPLFPMAGALLLKAGIPVSTATRLVSVIFVAAISTAIWISSKRAFGIRAAAMATAAFFSSVVVMDKGIEGFPNMLAFFWIFLAWLAWFALGMGRGRWSAAWFMSFTFCGLSFYTTGWEALFYFFLPLVFQRRPLSIWSRINKPGFYLGLAALAFFVIMWSYPRWIDGHDIPFKNIASEISGGYLMQLLLFPLDFFLRTFPWIFVAWPVFCAAYDEIEPNPIFSRFLKTIFFTLFFMNWIMPENDPRNYCLAMIPLAILAGSRYAILTGRHSLRINGMLINLGRIVALAALLSAIFYLLPKDAVAKIPFLQKGHQFQANHWKMGLLQSLLAVAICIYVERLHSMRRLPAFKLLVLLSTATMVLFWALHVPYRAQDSSQRRLASDIRNAVGTDFSGDLVIYETAEVSGDFYGVIAYLGCRARRLKEGAKNIPQEIQTAYLLSSEVPLVPERLWSQKLTFEGRRRESFLWVGERVQKTSNEKRDME